ncbi:hypothetical protein [Mesorhizobium sp. M1B.F.Ca.ET.045.04.1.1]|uniref:hypothetical protein n=1 Tax=Mesorhizobium sp. M1B.F.Ca.ET.045.04.1.1 TaxID=2493673 RepID=UPI001FDFCEF6|nr:hypothetical protein [Mesorhizobium sp. M1B.F.Ca.ET.045.04.1.1]
MQFFALLTRNTEKFSDADFAPLLPGEAEQRRTLYAQGAVRQVWNRGDVPGSGMMFEATDDKRCAGISPPCRWSRPA